MQVLLATNLVFAEGGLGRYSYHRQPAYILFVLATGLYIAARLCGLTDYSLGFDEIFSLTVVRPDWSGLIGLVVHDVVHPPLSYLLLKWERASKTARRSFCSPVWRQ